MNAAASLFMIANAVVIFHTQAWAQTPDAGKAEYLSGCGACHGNDAKGRGPLAGELKVAPVDLTQLAKRNGGIFPLNAVYGAIDGTRQLKSHGSREMPIWGYRYMPQPKFLVEPKSTHEYLDPSYDPEPIVRSRILSVIDYLYRIQEK